MTARILVALVLSLLASTSFANEKGNGGDILVAQFTGSMSNLVSAIGAKNPAACAPKADLARVLGEVTVYGKPVTFCDGHEQDACSFKSGEGKLITEISRSRFIQIKNAPLYMNLVLHEYYVHLGLETTNQMTLSKGCLDALTAEGVDASGLMNQISPISSLEQQMSEGKIILRWKSGNQGGEAKVNLGYRLDVPRCHDGMVSGGDFPTTVRSCGKTDHFPYAAVVQWRESNGRILAVAFSSSTSFASRLTGEYDIGTGVYTLSARYDYLETWVGDSQKDGYLHPSRDSATLTLTSTDHETWIVKLSSNGWLPFSMPNQPMTPVLRLQ